MNATTNVTFDRSVSLARTAAATALAAALAFAGGWAFARWAQPPAGAGAQADAYGHGHGHGHAGDHGGMHASAASDAVRPAPQAAAPCRPGAFLEADRIVGALTTAQRQLPAAAPEAVRRSIDVAMQTALLQARAEVHCVAGLTAQSYGREFAETIRGGVAVARARGASPDLLAAGEDTARALEASRPVAPATR